MTPGADSSFGVLKQIDAGALSVGYAEAGPDGGPAVVLLHGWPYDIQSYSEVTPLLARAGFRVIVPWLRGYGSTRFRSELTPRNGQQSVLGADTIALMDALGIAEAVIGGFDWGARTAAVIAALWPERCQALVPVSGYLIGNQQAGQEPLLPSAELSWWYQFYFATDRGQAGYDRYRREFARLIWHTASPKWDFDEVTFSRTAACFDNPDHVAVVIHNYRWRIGLATGEPQYDALEQQLARSPAITVPAITLEGDANGAPHPEPSAYREKFTGRYEHRTVHGGVGHNLPQEAPQAFAQAIIDASTLLGQGNASPRHHPPVQGRVRRRRPHRVAQARQRHPVARTRDRRRRLAGRSARHHRRPRPPLGDRLRLAGLRDETE